MDGFWLMATIMAQSSRTVASRMPGNTRETYCEKFILFSVRTIVADAN